MSAAQKKDGLLFPPTGKNAIGLSRSAIPSRASESSKPRYVMTGSSAYGSSIYRLPRLALASHKIDSV